MAYVGSVPSPQIAQIGTGAVETQDLQDGSVTTAKLAANAVTQAKLDSGISLGLKVSSVTYPGDDTAADPAGGQTITVNGSGFASTPTVYIDGTIAPSVTFVSSSQITFTSPAKSAGTYNLYVINTDGSVGIRVMGISYSGTPAWTTAAGSLGSVDASAISIQLVATSDTSVTYSLSAGSSLPSGVTLSSAGLISGSLASEQTFSFSVDAIDAENQATARSFSVTVTVGEPYFKTVVALITGDGTNGATNNTFLDSSTNNFTITRSGNTTQGTFTPFSKPAGKWGAYIDCSTGGYYLPDNALFDPNAALTLECWVCPAITGYDGIIWGSIDSAGDPWQGIYMRYDSTLKPYVQLYDYTGGGNPNYVYHQTAMVVGTWNHVAVIRSGSTWAVFLNGVKSSTTFSGSYSTDSAGITIGNAYTSSYGSSKMYISNLRLVRNASVYNFSGFTAPTSPLTAVADTAFLGFQDAILKDNSTNNFTITPYNSGSASGSPRVVTFSPFAQTSAYSTSTVGGSGYFDGTGDYLTAADNAALEFGNGDFTVQAWVYLSSLANNVTIFSDQVTAGSAMYFGLSVTTTGAITCTINDSAVVTTSAGDVQLHTWAHIAVSRLSGTLRVFRNGTQVGTTANSTTITAGDFKYIGYQIYGTRYLTGYVSGLMVQKGTGYSSISIPTSPTTSTTNTQLLLNFTNAGLRDESGFNDWENVGSTQVSTTQSKFGGSSILISSTYGNNGLIASNDPSRHHPWRISSSTVQTFECWLYPTNLSSYGNIFSYYWYQNGSVEQGWLIGLNNSGGLYYVNAASGGVTNFTGLSANAWQHFAAVFNAGNLKVFIGGTQVLNTSIGSPTYNGSERPGIGCAWSNGSAAGSFPGYIDDVRVSYGLARYTGTFTPPTTAFQTKGSS